MQFEYVEFYSKAKGSTYRVMDLEEYYELLPPEEKTQVPEGNDYQCTCPYCSEIAHLEDDSYSGKYMKHKLYITRNFGTGFCHRCDAIYITSNDDMRLELPDFNLDFKSLDSLDLSMRDPRYKLEDYNTKGQSLNHSDLMKLYTRNPWIMNHLSTLQIKKLSEGRYYLPITFKDELIYYQIWQPDQVPKYYSPPIKNKPIAVVGEVKSKAVLVEGYFDAVACLTLFPDHTPIALLGSYLTAAQEIMLRAYLFTEIKIYLDNSVLSYKLYNKIKGIFDMTDLVVRESRDQDAEEYLKSLINA